MSQGASRQPGEAGPRVFAPLANDYAAARPGYPATVFEALRDRVEAAPRAGNRAPLVVDVAAGTGIATRGLLDRGLRTLAVEPAREMLGQAVRALSGRPGWSGAVVGRGEALPLGASTMAAAVVAQAFHWLDAVPALDELARVLGPGGVLLLVWNVAEPNDFTREVWGLVERCNPGRKRPVTQQMRETPAPLREHPRFAVERPALVDHQRTLAVDEYVTYARSWSYIGGALKGEALDAFERELREILERHARAGTIVERLSTAAHFARRL